MSRQEKNSRVRMLPPRVQLQQRGALTGSYPTNVRFSTDGRTGKYNINFDDTKTIDFVSYSLITYNALTDSVIHYQRWSEDELLYKVGNNLYFKQSYVGNSNSETRTLIQNINKSTDYNAMVVNNSSGEVWPGDTYVKEKIKSIYINTGIYIQNNSLNTGGNYIDVASLNKPFAISMWIYPTQIDTGKLYPIAMVGRTNAAETYGCSWRLAINDKKLELNLYNTDGSDPNNKLSIFTEFEELTKNDWNHIVVEFRGNSTTGIFNGLYYYFGVRMYVNGTNVSLDSAPGSYTVMDWDVGSNLIIGSYYFYDGVSSTVDRRFRGYISEFLMLGKTLTENEVQFIKEATENAQNILTYDNGTIPPSINQPPLGYLPAIGLSTNSSWLQQPDASDVNQIVNTTITTFGNSTSEVVDGLPYIHFSPGQDITPFRDNDQPAVDGKSINNSFFATGSAAADIGEGFTSPLWSKNKIEIDISVDAPCGGTMFLSGVFFTSSLSEGTSYGNPTAPDTTQGKSQEMLYYNFEEKKWQGVGLGYPIGFINRGLLGNDTGKLPNAVNPLIPYDNKLMMGFAPSIVNLLGAEGDANFDPNYRFKTQVTGVYEWQASAAEPISSFGFPYHPKFHATGSQLLNMSNYITEPFLLEKVVVELSASYTLFGNVYSTASYNVEVGGITTVLTSITQSTIPAAINNFFILNQRTPVSYRYSENLLNDFTGKAILTTSIPTSIQLSPNATNVYVNTVRDLITYGGITSFASNMPTSSFRAGAGRTQVVFAQVGTSVSSKSENPKNLMIRECNFSSSFPAHNDLTALNWSGNVYMELPTKSPIRIDEVGSAENLSSLLSIGQNTSGLQTFWNLKYGGGGRNALGITLPNGRNYINPIAQVQNIGSFSNAYTGGRENIFVKSEDRYIYNPYILMPTDNLIFGWQQPFPNILYVSSSKSPNNNFTNAFSGSFSQVQFLPGPAKVTLYGSYIREGKEYNDGTNQLLSSDIIHEVIE